ncbi:lysine transporter LysE [Azospirillum sp. TSH100]|nr:lysine transporter LysE [Azospirillum sp. TSH100]QCG92068.1 LysE family translocator [Azospirillum sp. TSH100]
MPEMLAGFMLYALVTSITPGPNNMMVLASGVNFGLTRSVPHIVGISIGFSIMVVLVGAGLSAVFDTYPVIHDILRCVGAVYLVHLAWRIATSSPLGRADDRTAQRPMGFLAAAAFQWVNPKAWIMALGAITTYLPQQTSIMGVAVLALIFAVVNAPCVGIWAIFGVGLRRLLTKPSYVGAFNITMAALLVLSLYPIVIS